MKKLVPIFLCIGIILCAVLSGGKEVNEQALISGITVIKVGASNEFTFAVLKPEGEQASEEYYALQAAGLEDALSHLKKMTALTPNAATLKYLIIYDEYSDFEAMRLINEVTDLPSTSPKVKLMLTAQSNIGMLISENEITALEVLAAAENAQTLPQAINNGEIICAVYGYKGALYTAENEKYSQFE